MCSKEIIWLWILRHDKMESNFHRPYSNSRKRIIIQMLTNNAKEVQEKNPRIRKVKEGVGGTEALKFLAFLAFGAFLFISFHHACLKHTHNFCIVLVFVFDSWESTLVVSGKRIILPDLRESMPDHFPRDHKLRWWIIPRLIYPRHKHTYNHWQTGKPWKMVQFETKWIAVQ